jgi:hypothetical protein
VGHRGWAVVVAGRQEEEEEEGGGAVLVLLEGEEGEGEEGAPVRQ